MRVASPHVASEDSDKRCAADTLLEHKRFISCSVPLGLVSAYWRILRADWTAYFPKAEGSRHWGWGWGGAFSESHCCEYLRLISESLTDRRVSQRRKTHSGPYCYCSYAPVLIRSIYRVSDNKFCLSLCCSLHQTSLSLIKVNKLFISSHFLRNGLWQNASSGSRSQMQRLRR